MSAFNLVDFLHVLFTVSWIGGMIFMGLVLKPAMSAVDPSQAGKLFGVIAKRFTIVAWTSMIILLITGIMKTPDGAMFDTSAGYGLTLTIKHILFALATINGILITFVAAPKIRKFAPAPGTAPGPEFRQAGKMIDILSGTNTIFGVIILALATML